MNNKLYAEFQTNYGSFVVELFEEKTPITVANFKKLAESGFYDNTIFHRIIPDFMIQGGDPEGTGYGGSDQVIPDEFVSELTFDEAGVLAMANSGPNTGRSQFFITVVPTRWLQNHHTIFGKVVKNYAKVQEISNVETDFSDKPLKDVVLKKVLIKTEI
ncbi:peptidylprolyl isomerase [Dialister micraerophilus]|uniref:Peptidyl-prolyl cis-trans isomerase n=1 Tax=Dialister micraerophilus DSM 19965 TaxID=888062 RepID=F2BYD6_9FIRM|nr:peptidylprolyl isomerase [Dialister micraerophilus]EGF12457.1 peptidyl-prolyl cis-trans isomerase [Dialister micraerophilus DSM 19965]MDK8253735.1 peptidylprolyl isomerase [Dialister micraerophilus]MDK8285155.1 peptidylprolyl isomerase [Dialister micraerophilus]MDU5301617.1 peptidylprolyl isomerase [Dialister micraerophilus]